ncbi:hypothetical protein ACFW15_31695, partial [Streptomyces sp. NPDC058953]
MSVRTPEAPARPAPFTGGGRTAPRPWRDRAATASWRPDTRPFGIARGALALFLAAFAVFEAQKYGLSTTLAALLLFAAPGLAHRAVRGRGPVARIATHG